MLEEEQFWKQHWISHKVMEIFSILVLLFWWGKKNRKKVVSKNTEKDIKYSYIYIYIYIKSMKIENVSSLLHLKFNADPKTVLVLFLALIVFDFYSFEIYLKKDT